MKLQCTQSVGAVSRIGTEKPVHPKGASVGVYWVFGCCWVLCGKQQSIILWMKRLIKQLCINQQRRINESSRM